MTDIATQTEVLDVRGLRFATETNVVEATLGRQPGVLEVDANPIAQTATVTFDPTLASLDDLQTWVRECGYHCGARCPTTSVPRCPAVTGARTTETSKSTTGTTWRATTTAGCPWQTWPPTCATGSSSL